MQRSRQRWAAAHSTPSSTELVLPDPPGAADGTRAAAAQAAAALRAYVPKRVVGRDGVYYRGVSPR